MVTSGGERNKCRAWTYDRTPPLRNGLQMFPSAHPAGRQSGSGVVGWGGPGPCAEGGHGDWGSAGGMETQGRTRGHHSGVCGAATLERAMADSTASGLKQAPPLRREHQRNLPLREGELRHLGGNASRLCRFGRSVSWNHCLGRIVSGHHHLGRNVSGHCHLGSNVSRHVTSGGTWAGTAASGGMWAGTSPREEREQAPPPREECERALPPREQCEQARHLGRNVSRHRRLGRNVSGNRRLRRNVDGLHAAYQPGMAQGWAWGSGNDWDDLCSLLDRCSERTVSRLRS